MRPAVWVGIWACSVVRFSCKFACSFEDFARSLSLVSSSVGRIIGTGIFSTPSSILGSVGSVGASLMLWVLGFILSFCGLFIWLEFGTMIPRSGGEKVYLEAVYKKPKYLVTVIFAANAILLGFTASGCIVSHRLQQSEEHLLTCQICLRFSLKSGSHHLAAVM